MLVVKYNLSLDYNEEVKYVWVCVHVCVRVGVCACVCSCVCVFFVCV